jgi:hypothetical protein
MRLRALLVTGIASVLCPVLLLPPGGGAVGAVGAVATGTPGSPGVGDPYFPLYGNGGYDVGHYLLELAYDPAKDRLDGVATISARATQDLSQLNLDLQGLTVRSVRVDGDRATFRRTDDHELVITPSHPLVDGATFVTVVRYDGVPRTQELFGDVSGFMHTDDGAVIAGEPEVAANWYPVNDHPLDKASYTFKVTVPAGLEVVANGTLQGVAEARGRATWTWDAPEPMASYLATATIGDFDVRQYTANGRPMYDAVDPDLYVASVQPRTGSYYVVSGQADESYKRLTRTIAVPGNGGSLSFWVDRDTEQDWDYFFVEARTPGQDDWTTLPDLAGHTSQDTGASCPSGWGALHPQLAHYQTPAGDSCTPSGATGQWWAATGSSGGYEQWTVDLSRWAGSSVEVSLAYGSDQSVQGAGVFLDDVTTSTGEGTTSFEDDASPYDGWSPGPPPAGSPDTGSNFARTTQDGVQTVGDVVDEAFQRQGEILSFLSDQFGPYPFGSGGGIVDDTDAFGFALENQTRPIYSRFWFDDPVDAAFVVVHENAHQWYGDSVAVAQWKHIWLNEGFATYAEWLWSEREGFGTAQDNFDFFYDELFPADDPFWSVTIGDPGPEFLFDFAVYARGAMTLHALRKRVGDADFFAILRTWAAQKADGNGTTAEFVALSEQISGKRLGKLFGEWLFTASKPGTGQGPAGGGGPNTTSIRSTASMSSIDLHRAPAAARSLVLRLGR